MTLPALPSLQRVGSIPIPAAALNHLHTLEARAAVHVLGKSDDRDAGVVGTQNIRRAELYGWANPVRPHVDGTGAPQWMYGALLIGQCQITTGVHTVCAEPGVVFRLNDRQLHWTQGAGDSVSVFVGCWDTPEDQKALQILERGVRRLASHVRTAPRVREGFRVRRKGEVYATCDFETYSIMASEVAKRCDAFVLTCCECDEPADRIDNQFPWSQEHYCRKCDG